MSRILKNYDCFSLKKCLIFFLFVKPENCNVDILTLIQIIIKINKTITNIKYRMWDVLDRPCRVKYVSFCAKCDNLVTLRLETISVIFADAAFLFLMFCSFCFSQSTFYMYGNKQTNKQTKKRKKKGQIQTKNKQTKTKQNKTKQQN